MDVSAAPRWLNDSEMAAWRSYIETQIDLTSALEADLERAGLTLGDYQVLVHLDETEGRAMRMRDLADRLQLSPSGLTRRLDGLVRNGWVERRGSDADRRVMMAVLTETGHQRLVDAAPAHVESVRQHIFDVLDRDDIQALATIFDKIRAGLDGRIVPT